MRRLLPIALLCLVLVLPACGEDDPAADPMVGTYVSYDSQGAPSMEYQFAADGTLTTMFIVGGARINMERAIYSIDALGTSLATVLQDWVTNAWVAPPYSFTRHAFPVRRTATLFAQGGYQLQYGSMAGGQFTSWNVVASNANALFHTVQTLRILSPASAQSWYVQNGYTSATNALLITALGGQRYRFDNLTQPSKTNTFKFDGTLLYDVLGAAYK